MTAWRTGVCNSDSLALFGVNRPATLKNTIAKNTQMLGNGESRGEKKTSVGFAVLKNNTLEVRRK